VAWRLRLVNSGFSYREVVMKRFILNWVGVLALLVLPLGGCSDTTTDGTGGAAGSGGEGGAAGAAGTGGEAGGGGAAGIGGIGGGGGTVAVPPGVWTGTGMGGSSGSADVCFVVNAEGTALTQGTDSEQPCQLFAWEVMFDDCAGSFSYKLDIPIEDGSFELILEGPPDIEVRGTFDGNTATGEVSSAGDATCSAQWEAAPNE